MKLWPSRPCCGATITAETSTIEAPRGNPPSRKRAKQIHHFDEPTGRRWWHWSDVEVRSPLYPAFDPADPTVTVAR